MPIDQNKLAFFIEKGLVFVESGLVGEARDCYIRIAVGSRPLFQACVLGIALAGKLRSPADAVSLFPKDGSWPHLAHLLDCDLELARRVVAYHMSGESAKEIMLLLRAGPLEHLTF
ncbi:MAG TPA: hypothetical protein VJH67_02400 [Candidatus Paceibacterota bacterium]